MRDCIFSALIIVFGIVIFMIGCIQPFRYEMAKENGYEVEATIVDIETAIEDDSETGLTSTSYTIYADYEVDGKAYKGVRVGKYYDTEKYAIGDKINVVVNPNAPGKPMFEGGILCVIGFLVSIGGIIAIIPKKNTA